MVRAVDADWAAGRTAGDLATFRRMIGPDSCYASVASEEQNNTLVLFLFART